MSPPNIWFVQVQGGAWLYGDKQLQLDVVFFDHLKTLGASPCKGQYTHVVWNTLYDAGIYI